MQSSLGQETIDDLETRLTDLGNIKEGLLGEMTRKTAGLLRAGWHPKLWPPDSYHKHERWMLIQKKKGKRKTKVVPEKDYGFLPNWGEITMEEEEAQRTLEKVEQALHREEISSQKEEETSPEESETDTDQEALESLEQSDPDVAEATEKKREAAQKAVKAEGLRIRELQRNQAELKAAENNARLNPNEIPGWLQAYDSKDRGRSQEKRSLLVRLQKLVQQKSITIEQLCTDAVPQDYKQWAVAQDTEDWSEEVLNDLKGHIFQVENKDEVAKAGKISIGGREYCSACGKASYEYTHDSWMKCPMCKRKCRTICAVCKELMECLGGQTAYCPNCGLEQKINPPLREEGTHDAKKKAEKNLVQENLTDLKKQQAGFAAINRRLEGDEADHRQKIQSYIRQENELKQSIEKINKDAPRAKDEIIKEQGAKITDFLEKRYTEAEAKYKAFLTKLSNETEEATKEANAWRQKVNDLKAEAATISQGNIESKEKAEAELKQIQTKKNQVASEIRVLEDIKTETQRFIEAKPFYRYAVALAMVKILEKSLNAGLHSQEQAPWWGLVWEADKDIKFEEMINQFADDHLTVKIGRPDLGIEDFWVDVDPLGGSHEDVIGLVLASIPDEENGEKVDKDAIRRRMCRTLLELFGYEPIHVQKKKHPTKKKAKTPQPNREKKTKSPKPKKEKIRPQPKPRSEPISAKPLKLADWLALSAH